MTVRPRATASDTGGRTGTLRSPIIANRCNDEGVCLMCGRCGHVFLPSIPLNDESEELDNVTLSKNLYYHACTIKKVGR